MQTIVKPIITEQSMKNTQGGIFTFEVARYAAKPQIREAIERLYHVHVVSITTQVHKGKVKRVGKKRVPLQRPDHKIARAHLKKGEKITAFELANV